MPNSHILRFTSAQMDHFRTRVTDYLEKNGGSSVTLSKKLFRGNAATLPGILAGDVSPQFKNMVMADEALTSLVEAALEQAT